MASGVTSKAPHGGIFVFFAIGSVGMFVVSIRIGTVTSALAVIARNRQAVKRSTANGQRPTANGQRPRRRTGCRLVDSVGSPHKNRGR